MVLFCQIGFRLPILNEKEPHFLSVFIKTLALLEDRSKHSEVGLQVDPDTVQFFSMEPNTFGHKTRKITIPTNNRWNFYKQEYEYAKYNYNVDYTSNENILHIDNVPIEFPQGYKVTTKDMILDLQNDPCVHYANGKYKLTNENTLTRILRHLPNTPVYFDPQIGYENNMYFLCRDKKIESLLIT